MRRKGFGGEPAEIKSGFFAAPTAAKRRTEKGKHHKEGKAAKKPPQRPHPGPGGAGAKPRGAPERVFYFLTLSRWRK